MQSRWISAGACCWSRSDRQLAGDVHYADNHFVGEEEVPLLSVQDSTDTPTLFRTMSRLVFVLKAENTSKGVDPYKKALLHAGYEPVFVEVLSFRFVNLAQLVEVLRRGEGHSGLVFTSQTAVRAVAHCVSEGLLSQDSLIQQWNKKPVYVVGGGTANVVRSLGLSPQGEETGQADKLAELIIESMPTPPDHPLLFPCGRIRKDTLPVKLKSQGFPLHEVICYDTCASADVGERLTSIVKEKGCPEWTVLFSPSGVKSVFEALPDFLGNTKIATIGPTTSEAVQTSGLKVTVCSSAPQPARLVEAMMEVVSVNS